MIRLLCVTMLLLTAANPAGAETRQGLPSDDVLCSARSCPRAEFWPTDDDQAPEPCEECALGGAGR